VHFTRLSSSYSFKSISLLLPAGPLVTRRPPIGRFLDKLNDVKFFDGEGGVTFDLLIGFPELTIGTAAVAATWFVAFTREERLPALPTTFIIIF